MDVAAGKASAVKALVSDNNGAMFWEKVFIPFEIVVFFPQFSLKPLTILLRIFNVIDRHMEGHECKLKGN